MNKPTPSLLVLCAAFLLCSHDAKACSGYGCDGKDPVATGCSAGAVTAARKVSNVTPFQNIVVELRWSPVCKTNWTRVSTYYRATTYDPVYDAALAPVFGPMYIIRTAPSTSYVAAVNQTAGTYWTPMLYGHGLCVRSRAEGFEKNFYMNLWYVDLATSIVC